MSSVALKLLLWLLVLVLGISFGAGLYESRIQVPTWLQGTEATGYTWNRAAANAANVGVRFWVYVTTIPLTLLTLIGTVAVWWAPATVRVWLLATVLVCVAERALTFGYFIPTMLRLMKHGASDEGAAVATALEWVRLGYVRHAANALALLTALKAFAAFYLRLTPQ